jgi:hypothetical protein
MKTSNLLAEDFDQFPIILSQSESKGRALPMSFASPSFTV